MNLTTSKPSVWLQHPRDSNRVPLWPGELPELTQPLNSYGPVPCHSRTWEHGCSLHDDGKFLACRISLEFPNSNFIRLWWSSGKMLCLLHRWRGFDSRARHLWQAKFGHELHWWRDSLKLCWTCLSFTKNQTTWTLYPLNTKSGCNTLGIRTGSPSDLESFPSLLKPLSLLNFTITITS